MTTPALPPRVAADRVPVSATWATVPVSSLPVTPRVTVPAVADTTLRVALVAPTISMAVPAVLAVWVVPSRLMLKALLPPSTRMLPLSASMTEPRDWVTLSPPRNTSPWAVMLRTPMASAPLAPSPVAVRRRRPPALVMLWVSERPEVES